MGLFKQKPVLAPQSTGGVSMFTSLSDVPSSYAGQAGKFLRVNVGETALEFVTSSGSVADGDYGDITVSASGAAWTIDNSAVTYAKIQNVSATDKILGRSTAGAGVIEEITCTAFGRSLIDDTAASDGRTTLGLGSIATQAASSVTITGGSITGTTVTVSDAAFTIQDNADATKQVVFELSGITTITTRTITVPDASGTMTLLGNSSTGSGVVVLANTPTLITPVLGVATATSINKVVITAPATSATLTIADGKTLTMSNTLTFTGTDASSVAFGAGGTVAYVANKLSVFAATTSAELAGVISDESGSGALVFANTPTLVTPVLGVATATSINKVVITAPATSATLTIADGKTLTMSNTLTFTGTDLSSVAFGAGGTVTYTSNKLSVFAATTSAELAGVISDESGSGALVFANTPTLVTPVLGVATATSINKVAITAPATSATLTIADGKTVTVSNTLTFTGTDASSVAFSAGGTVAYVANKLSVFAATTSAELAGVISDETGSGALVFGTAPTMASITVNGTSSVTITQDVATSGSPAALLVTGGAHTTLTASTEASSVEFQLSASVQFATGALTVQRAFLVVAPVYTFVGASTITTAATFAVSGAPTAGTNATITNNYSILSQDGDICFTRSSNAALVVNFLGANSVGAGRTVTFKGALTASSANSDFTFATTGTTRTAGSILSVVNNATTRFSVAFNGAITVTQAAGTTGAPAVMTLTGAAHTTLTASGSFTDLSLAFARTVQMATGAVAFAKVINITAPTLAFVGASTITDAATLYISGAPTAGTNATITSPYALYCASGIIAFGGDVRFLQQSTEFLVYGTQTSTTYLIFRGNQSAAGTGSDVRIGTSATRTAGYILQLSNVNTVNNQWDYTGGYEMIQSAGATGVRHSLKITAGAHTNQTASTESSEILFDLSATKQFATGAIAGQRSIRILAPTYSFVGASTITDAATFYINGAPTAGTNATITNAWALWVDLGTSRFDGMLDLSAIAAGSPNLKITATSDTPTVTWGAAAGNEASTAPAGYMEINVGGNARYIPYWA